MVYRVVMACYVLGVMVLLYYVDSVDYKHVDLHVGLDPIAIGDNSTMVHPLAEWNMDDVITQIFFNCFVFLGSMRAGCGVGRGGVQVGAGIVHQRTNATAGCLL